MATPKTTGGSAYMLPPEYPKEFVCLTVRVPKSLYWYQLVWGELYRLTRWTSYERDEARNAMVAAAYARSWIYPARGAMPRWDESSSLVCEDGVLVGDTPALPACVRLLDCSGDGVVDTVEIIEDEECMVNVNVYGCGCGCGCGCGGNGGSAAGGVQTPAGPPANPNDPTSAATLCDAVTTLAPYLIDAYDDVIGKIQTGTLFTSPFELTPLVGELVEGFAELADGTEQAINDADFLPIMQRAIARVLPDVSTDINRQQLRQLSSKLPLIFEGGSPQTIARIYAEVANLQELNAALRSTVAGSGVVALCSEIGAAVGRNLSNPFLGEADGDASAIETVLVGATYTAHLMLEDFLTIAPLVTFTGSLPNDKVWHGIAMRGSYVDGGGGTFNDFFQPRYLTQGGSVMNENVKWDELRQSNAFYGRGSPITNGAALEAEFGALDARFANYSALTKVPRFSVTGSSTLPWPLAPGWSFEVGLATGGRAYRIDELWVITEN